jgi:hypothetical protein
MRKNGDLKAIDPFEEKIEGWKHLGEDAFD